MIDALDEAEARFEAACQRHDALRHDRDGEETPDEMIAYVARQIALNADMATWADWRLLPNPERMRAECRAAVEVWTRELHSILIEREAA